MALEIVSDAKSHLDLLDRMHAPGGFMLFCRYFMEELTGRPYSIPRPIAGRPHVYILCQALEDVFWGKIKNLNLIMPPGYLKTTHMLLFIAWCYTIYPDCNFIYWSYSKEVAETHTSKLRKLMSSPRYQRMFRVYLDKSENRRDHFSTFVNGKRGGTVIASGLNGSITGLDGGIAFEANKRFTGGVFGDDGHKPGEMHSQTIIKRDHRLYDEIISQRARGDGVPQVYAAQCSGLHDFSNRFRKNEDAIIWTTVHIKSLSDFDESTAPELKSTEMLKRKRELMPYVFAAQYQGEPVSESGNIFNRGDFPLLDHTPNILATAITIDCAATDKTYNDATSFTFAGVYRLAAFNDLDIEILECADAYGLHILNNWEIRVLPGELKSYFMSFYSDCLQSRLPRPIVIIENASAGIWLADEISRIPGLECYIIDRTKASGSKSNRFVQCQGFTRKKLVSFPMYGEHTERCIRQLIEVTPDCTHKHDDIVDTIADQIHATWINKILLNSIVTKGGSEAFDRHLAGLYKNRQNSNLHLGKGF